MKKIIIILLTFGISGCSTMFSGTTQSVQIVPVDKMNNQILDSTIICTLKNTEGEWIITAPNSAVVHRGGGTLYISCKDKDGRITGNTSLSSNYNYTNLWNIGLLFIYIVPGAVGFIVDGVNGSISKYNENVVVTMH